MEGSKLEKVVSYNARKGVYIVTIKGKKGIQSQSTEPPKDAENVFWKCENPHKKKVDSALDSDILSIPEPNKEAMEVESTEGAGVDWEKEKESDSSGFIAWLLGDS